MNWSSQKLVQRFFETVVKNVSGHDKKMRSPLISTGVIYNFEKDGQHFLCT
jgi:hypothetical protein